MLRSLLVAAGLTLTLFAFVACTDDEIDQGSPTSTAATQPGPTQPAGTVVATPTALVRVETTESPASAEFGRDPIDEPGTATANATVTLAQAGSPGDFDRMTFQFDGGLPGYQISYITGPVTDCAAGQQVQLQGNAFLQVRLSPAAAHDDAGNPTVTSTDLTPGSPQLLEAKQICDFEGVVTWVLGLTAEADYRVFTLGDALLVVDVQHS